MRSIAIWLVLAVVGLAGCGCQARLDYTNADQQRNEAGEASHEWAGQQSVSLEVANLDQVTPRATEVEVSAVEPASSKEPDRSSFVTIFVGGVHYHGDLVIEPERRDPVPQPNKATKLRDQRSERLRREHEDRLAEWLTKFH